MPDDTALVPIEEGHVVRLGEARPQGTIELATSMANALADIVEKKRLFTVISGKKFPQVEAWMTIARMDNVVAREMANGVTQLEDGSFEAQVELIRLSDGLVIGHGSALCGTPGDRPWDSRPMPQRRSMAVTRATSRAFRQQYSWIMALAGYEPTPAEEMADGQRPVGSYDTPPDRPELERMAEGLIGTAEVGKARDSDFELRKSGDDEHFALGFKLKSNGGGFKVLTHDELALQLLDAKDEVVGKLVTVWGRISTVNPGPTDKWRAFQVIDAERIKTAAGTLPIEDGPGKASGDVLMPGEGKLGPADFVSPLREEDAPSPGQEELALLDPEERALVAGGQP